LTITLIRKKETASFPSRGDSKPKAIQNRNLGEKKNRISYVREKVAKGGEGTERRHDKGKKKLL